MRNVFRKIVLDRLASRVTVESCLSDKEALYTTEEVMIKIERWGKHPKALGVVLTASEVEALRVALAQAVMAFYGSTEAASNAEK